MIVFNIGLGHFRPPDRYYIGLRRKPPARAVKHCADKWSIFYTFTYNEYIPSLGICNISGQLEYYKDVVAMVMFHDITFYDRSL